jgi:pimeloyl-ACP methyl ester carboxylesterase
VRRTLLVTGEEDRIAPAERLRDLVARVPGAHLEVLPEADHFFTLGLAGIGRAVARFLEV